MHGPGDGNPCDACHYASLAPAANEQCINKSSIGLIADVNVRLIDEALVTRR